MNACYTAWNRGEDVCWCLFGKCCTFRLKASANWAAWWILYFFHTGVFNHLSSYCLLRCTCREGKETKNRAGPTNWLTQLPKPWALVRLKWYWKVKTARIQMMKHQISHKRNDFLLVFFLYSESDTYKVQRALKVQYVIDNLKYFNAQLVCNEITWNLNRIYTVVGGQCPRTGYVAVKDCTPGDWLSSRLSTVPKVLFAWHHSDGGIENKSLNNLMQFMKHRKPVTSHTRYAVNVTRHSPGQ